MGPTKKTIQQTNNIKKAIPLVTSTSLRSKVAAKTSQTRRDQTRKRTQKDTRSQHYSLGAGDADANAHIYKFTGKQTKGWRPIDKQLKDYLYHLIDSGVESVSSKTTFVDDEDVQDLLSVLKLRLKSKILSMKVPNKKYGDYSKLKAIMVNLKEEAENLTLQELALEKEIRQEERLVESLEDANMLTDRVDLCIQVPDNQLSLPDFVFSKT